MPQPQSRHFADFYVIGAAKCGTTTLARYLARHPDVFVTKPKEPEFLAKENPGPEDWERYASYFAAAGGRLAGEASTIYTRHPHFSGVPERMAALTPDAKLLYIVREPVYRAHADCATIRRFWFNTRRSAAFELSFEEALEHGDPLMKSILDAGRYHYQISQYLKAFPRENLLVVSMEELVGTPSQVLERVLAFLDIIPFGAEGTGPELAANRRSDFHAKVARHRAIAFLGSLPFAGALRPLVPEWLKERIYAVLSSRVSTDDISLPPMKPETFARLRSFYREDTENLAKDFGIDVSGWKTITYDEYAAQCR